MTPHYEDEHLTVYLGDCREVMAAMPAESVQTVITSPPYFSLRDYGLEGVVWGGDPAHEHDWTERSVRTSGGVYLGKTRWQHQENGRAEVQPGDRRQYRVAGHPEVATGSFCACGAWYGNLGLEPSPDLYVDHVVVLFREVRRVLRRGGTLWLNIGDSYADRANRRSDGESFREDRADVVPAKVNTIGGAYALKAKDRMMMPAHVAIALQADGWWLRDEIVWVKPNPMPSSVTDRTTPAHEMVYLLTKSARYHYDADAIREPGLTTRPALLEFGPRPDVGHPGHSNDRRRVKVPYRDKTADNPRLGGRRQPPEPGEPNAFHPLGRNKRSVWTVATQPYPDAHFATFPEALITPMILAGAQAGDVVLDPFGGSGTTAMVANRLGRRAVHIDLSAEYTDQAIERIARARAEGDGPAIDMPVAFASDGLWAADA